LRRLEQLVHGDSSTLSSQYGTATWLIFVNKLILDILMSSSSIVNAASASTSNIENQHASGSSSGTSTGGLWSSILASTVHGAGARPKHAPAKRLVVMGECSSILCKHSNLTLDP
jgi:hypothetical protein